jgi:hypothetical protein
MLSRDRFAGSAVPFEGDRTLVVRNLPRGARVTSARITLEPVAPPGGRLFEEKLTFSADRGDFGATKLQGAGFVEVDFHARRTLGAVKGSGLAGATLQVDLGGLYIQVTSLGTMQTPSDTSTYAVGSGSGGPLPSLATGKFKLTGAPNVSPDLAEVVVRSAPSNLTLRLGQEPPFYARPGELASAETCPDFARILQAFLTGAEVVDGFYRIPVVVHSDSVGRLDVRVELEFVEEVNALDDDLKQAVMSFDHGSAARSGSGSMSVRLPAGARVVPGSTTARVRGAFQASRIVYGPTGGLKPTGDAEVSEGRALATPLRMEAGLKVSAVDVLLGAKSTTAALTLDIVQDADGKPWTESILPAPVDLAIDHEIAGTPTWVNVPLPREVELEPGVRYWLVIQSLRGSASWGVSARDDVEAAGTSGSWTRFHDVARDAAAGRALGVAFTSNGGLSWREETAPGVAGPLVAFVHLRDVPAAFQMPIELQVGEGPSARRVSLERFQPLGRVDFSLDFDAVAEAVNAFAENTAQVVAPEGEHLRNGEMEAWTKVGDRLQLPPTPQLVSHQPVELVTSADGRRVYALTKRDADGGADAFLEIYRTVCGAHVATIELGEGEPVALAVSPDGTRAIATLLLDAEDESGVRPGALIWVDLEVLAVVGQQTTPVQKGRRAEPVAAFSSDGALLYVGGNLAPVANRSDSLVVAFSAADADAAFRQSSQDPLGALQDTQRLALPFQGQPVRILPSPDGSLVHVGVVNELGQALELYTIDAGSFAPLGPPIALGFSTGSSFEAVGAAPIILSQSADGTRLVAVNRDQGTVSVIDTERSELAFPPLIDESTPPVRYVAAALSPDGRRLFVARQVSGSRALTALDLSSGQAIDIDLETPASTLAVTPGGERLYVGSYIGNFSNNSPSSGQMLSLQIGALVPEEWTLTSGSVFPLCFSTPLHRLAALGDYEALKPKSEDGPEPPRSHQVSALSEVVPVVAGVHYALTFVGYAATPDAVAEIIWHGDQCAPLRTDRVEFDTLPIDAERFKLAVRSVSGLNQELKTSLGEKVTRLEATSPAGASSAEIRFTVPANEVALLDRASFQATSDSLVNGDFQAQRGNNLSGWELFPEHAAGMTIVASAGAVTLRNGGAEVVSLLQEVSFESDTDFSLSFRGRGKPGVTGEDPHVVLEWLDENGDPLPSFTEVAVTPDASDRSERRGTSPASAKRARVTLELPRGSTLELEAVALEPIFVTTIPISFVAQAPGDVTVSDVRVAYEKSRPPPPPVPTGGLCPPSLPPSAGSERCCCCHCPSCGSDDDLIDPQPTTTPGGVPARTGECRSCGARVTVPGGPPAATVGRAPPAPVRRTAAPKRAEATTPTRARVTRAPFVASTLTASPRDAVASGSAPATKTAAPASAPTIVETAATAPEPEAVAPVLERNEPVRAPAVPAPPATKQPELETAEPSAVSTALIRLVRERPKTVASALGAAREGVAAVIREAKQLRRRVERRRRGV